MRSFILFVLIGIVSSLIGCNGTHCIEIGGDWKNINGNIKYCWSQETKSERPILTDESGEKAVLITQEDVVNITKKLEKSTDTSTSNNSPTDTMAIKSISAKTLPQQIETMLKNIYQD